MTAVRHVVKVTRAAGGWQAVCRCGWVAVHPAYIGAKAAEAAHKNAMYALEHPRP